ncbi:hypothetical protein [Legionella maioricensis]|uniref:Uncharacterized protein n=1 Tax=Legionella maioricensis TaxID=2896528 RepID=A0A9X2CYG4_9GAMM|nr:hypothetical protein [Legionella maioricensis]MCL9683215.1 hypothetical protein [Legionella maioricensis]MCL9686087.1 hypothetical protein [Legionella maioricensis]
MPLALTVFFTPAIITTSLFSKELIAMLANLSLSLGYLTNFAYKIYQKEISKSELMISSLTLVAFLIIAYTLCPPIAALSFFSALSFLNQLAVAVNLFFLMKHVVVPPCKKMIENIAQYMGFNIAGRYYSRPPLTLEHDRFILDQLLLKTYGHDSFSAEFNETEIVSFNKLLLKLSEYIDKYDESIFGYINNKDAIADLEKQIAQLTTRATTDSSYAFIRRKIGFKTTKINLLQEAKETVSATLENPFSDAAAALRFFKGVDANELEQNRELVLSTGLQCLQNEIQRQQEKITSLQVCLPQAGGSI